jgi:hypothetical protein
MSILFMNLQQKSDSGFGPRPLRNPLSQVSELVCFDLSNIKISSKMYYEVVAQPF